MKTLIDVALQNSLNCSNRNRFDETVKKFSLYLFYIGGRLLYETLHANLKNALPSIATLNRYAAKHYRSLEEGNLDFEGLRTFLEDRSLPKRVWISEDGTRVTAKVEYDEKTNKIIGFTLPLINGLPKTDAYIASSAKTIEDYFRQCIKSHYAYAIMAQPLSDKAPPYCLGLFGTDNRFTANDVKSRWSYMIKTAEEFGIHVVGFSSDGDSRFMKSMRENSVLPIPENEEPLNGWSWFRMRYGVCEADKITYIQDTVHIATKFRTRLLKPSIVLPMGNYTASVSHLETLVSNFSKDQHLLTHSDLKPEDKMNFLAARKICTPLVQELLSSKVPGSEGTVAFLKIMDYAIKAFLEKNISIPERLYCLWYCVVFIRLWRNWITKHPAYKIQNNFLSSNLYLCIELNAHGLVKLIKNFSKDPDIDANMFLPWKFSSQPCEQLFRALRSMTTTFSTVVNFSIKDILHRIDRLQMVNNIINDLGEKFVFPREEKKDCFNVRCFDSEYDFTQISDGCIEVTIEKALQDCLKDAKEVGIDTDPNACNVISIKLRSSLPLPCDEVEVNDGEICDDDELIIDDEVVVAKNDSCDNILENTCIESLREAEEEETFTDVANDLYHNLDLDVDLNLSRVSIDHTFGKDLHLKNYSHGKDDILVERNDLVRISLGSQTAVIKKSSLCWLLENERDKVSTDRLRRFVNNKAGNKAEIRIQKTLGKSTAFLKRKVRTSFKSGPKAKRERKRREEIEEMEEETSEDSATQVVLDDSTDTEDFDDDSEGRRSTIIDPRYDVDTRDGDMNINDFVVVELSSLKGKTEIYRPNKQA